MVREKVSAWWSNRQDRERKLLSVLAAVLAGVLFIALLWHGVKVASEVKKDLLDMRNNLRAAQAEVASLSSEKTRLDKIKNKWSMEKIKLWRDAEGGITLKDIEDVACSSGAKLMYFEPEKRVEAFYNNHLRAVPVKVKFAGTFPAVLMAMEKIEYLANPGEIRAVKIEAVKGNERKVPGSVESDITLVLYSLNPPELWKKVFGTSGRYDPFWSLIISEDVILEGEKMLEDVLTEELGKNSAVQEQTVVTVVK